MDPFSNSASLPEARRRFEVDQPGGDKVSDRYKGTPQTTGDGANGGKSQAGLRRSAGLFNLKLDSENQSSENFDSSEPPLPHSFAKRDIAFAPAMLNAYGRSTTFGADTSASSLNSRAAAMIMTPDSSASSGIVASAVRRRSNNLSLKRPHPFSSSKPTKHAGFLSRSSASYQDAMSPAGQKRLHLGDRDSSTSLGRIGDLTPDLSFRGAKPVQTAFVSSGLQSKKHVSQSPKPMVPETPCKRPIEALDKDSSHSFHSHSILDNSHCSPFPGANASFIAAAAESAGSGGRAAGGAGGSPKFPLTLSERLTTTTMPAGCTSPSTSTCSIDSESPLVNHPIDRLQRFSIGHISTSVDDLEVPETPTKLGNNGALVHTSTPLFRYSVGAGRQPSEAAATATPGTAVKPRTLPSVLQSADPADSLSMSPPEPFSMNNSIGAASSSPSDTSTKTHLSPRTPDVEEVFDRRRRRRPSSHGDSLVDVHASEASVDSLILSSSAESQSSPKPRRRLRLFDFWHTENHTGPSLPAAHQHHHQHHHSNSNSGNLPHAAAAPNHSHVRHYSHDHNKQRRTRDFSDRGRDRAASAEARDISPTKEAPPPLPALPPVPPLRTGTPLGRPPAADDNPRTPGHSSSSLPLQNFAASNSTIADASQLGTHHSSSFQSPDHSACSSKAQSLLHFSLSSQGSQHNHRVPHDELLAAKFERVQSAAFGEFSAVFVVAEGKQRYAVKRTKRPMLGQRERLRRREEVDILRSLSSPTETHIVHLIDEWEANGYGYIMTDYCENGDLSRFLADQGRVSRLEEWRVWKILFEILQGLAVVHAHNILHLDLKPANIFVSFEGHLKIGDFGMATWDPVPAGFEREGDREYIAPEVLERQQYGKPADVFSVGLMMVEIAANIVLPDNGVHWHRLRSGDLSDAGRLSSGDLTSASSRVSAESRAPPWAPKFLVDDECLLDRVVSQMLSPQPERRPTVAQLLLLPEMLLVDQRGQAGAVVYEGEFGPEPEADNEVNVWQRA